MEDHKTDSTCSEDLFPLKIANIKERRDFYKQKSFSSKCETLFEDYKDVMISDGDYRCPPYLPNEYKRIQNYEDRKVLYELPLSPSIISLVE
jgi:hypothetical protein